MKITKKAKAVIIVTAVTIAVGVGVITTQVGNNTTGNGVQVARMGIDPPG